VGTSGRGVQYGYGPASNLSTPSFPQQAVVNAASYQGGGVAAGEVVTVFGQRIGPALLAPAALDETGSLSDMLQGTQLFFDGSPAPLVYASSGQLGAVVPYSVGGNSTTSVQVSYLGALSPPVIVPVVPAVPAIFTLSGEGTGGGVIQVNVEIPDSSPTGPAVSLVISAGRVNSQAGVTVSVK
jgi:hypothetical protein